jgi:hypothetical protein
VKQITKTDPRFQIFLQEKDETTKQRRPPGKKKKRRGKQLSTRSRKAFHIINTSLM